MPDNFTHHPSSYRDPSGFIFKKNGVLYRQVNKIFREDFDLFISSGCYESLVKKGSLIPHRALNENLTGDEEWYATLQPEPLSFISYPYEWGFEMLKDAALLTLDLLKAGLGFGMLLKDATPYNIQWHKGKLIFIDSLSFEKYDETIPWIAYRQFCEHFLSPLLLAHHSRMPLQELLLAYSDGIPLAVTRSLLPWKTKFSMHTYLHIHLHAKYSMQQPTSPEPAKKNSFSKKKLLNLVASLEGLIKTLRLPDSQSTWSGYYDEASQRADYLEHKQKIIGKWIEKISPVATAADLGANKGEFSKLTAAKDIQTTAADFDPFCINTLYQEIKRSTQKNILPLIIDLSKPSPAIGVNNEERDSFINRAKVDLVLALALVHHLAIGKNIPFEKIAYLFQGICRYLIIEFVPKQDEKIQLMLSTKKDIYTQYTEENFIAAFTKYFIIKEKETIAGSGRTLYLMKKNEG
ncbi:MAG: SAM-dependent methyltransferase [Ferruginibacter sp.]|nr:SAM-dependent methyltransferase [Chitinophagaceae bacterium]